MLLQRPRTERSAVLREARDTTRRVARTFAIACRLLPRPIRDDVYLLYLVFRTLDDLVDGGSPDAGARLGAVEEWCRDGSGSSAEVSILDDVATRHDLPRHAILDFCRGMRCDLAGHTIETEQQLEEYCYRVAGTVGVVMAHVLEVSDDSAYDDAAALGMAMQLTNILRDIDEDLAQGRVYLAQESVARCGSLEAGRREALMRDQIPRAEALYERGEAGIPKLRRGRRAIAMAAAMYREILRQIEREGYGARPGRAVVPRRRKYALAARAGARTR